MTQEGTNLIPAQVWELDNILHTHSCREIAATLSLVGDKWTVLVIAFLTNGPRRFNELKRLIDGITQRMLTITLRQLEREGLVTRTMYPTIPPRVDYELTELGHSLNEPLQALGSWVVRNQDALAAARTRFDSEKAD